MRERLRLLWTVAALAFRADRPAATVATALFALQGALQPLEAVFAARLVAAAIARDGDAAFAAAVSVLVIEAVLFAVSMASLDLRFRLSERTGLLVEQQLIEAMTGAPGLDLHERPAHLDRIEVLRKQLGGLSQSVAALLQNVSSTVALVTVVGVLASLHPLLVLLPVAGVPALVVAARTSNALQQAQQRTAEPSRRAEHLFDIGTSAAAGKELRTFGLGRELVVRHDTQLLAAHREMDRVERRWAAAAGASWAILGAARVGAIALVAWEASHGRADIADVLLAVSLTATLDGYLQHARDMVAWLFNVLRTVERYDEVLAAASALGVTVDLAEVAGEPAPVPERLTKGIELDGVSFRYPDTETDVLRDVHLAIPAGTIVAVVGENGAGKSTIVKLLARYYEPTAGTIRVDGVDLRRLDVRTWRSRLSGAFQDHARFELVAAEVVGVGDLDLVDDRPAITDAIERGGGGDLPDRLERGLDTPLGRSFEDGVEPSGGQWQLLALGRAMLRSAPLVLLLDEPTAALDPDAEHRLFTSYAGAAREAAATAGAITVLVSHRFSTVRMADLIVVVGDGTVTEAGTHEELLALGGSYAELYALQARAYQ